MDLRFPGNIINGSGAIIYSKLRHGIIAPLRNSAEINHSGAPVNKQADGKL